MKEVVDDVIALRAPDPGGLQRMMTLSFGVHIGVLLLLFLLPRDWITRAREQPILITVNLGGSIGEKSGGETQVGGKPVEEVAPPPKRPEPPRPIPEQKEVMSVPPKTPPKPAPSKPAETAPAPAPPAARPPATGAQVTPGTARAETGTTGQGTGLTSGGGFGGPAVATDSAFCCPEYLGIVQRLIDVNWKQRVQSESGATRIKFEIYRNGTVSRPEVEQSSGLPMLDIASRAAISGLKLPPLPPEYKEDKLIVHITFTYKR